jgi:putative tricarboxylic transport membrane protein
MVGMNLRCVSVLAVMLCAPLHAQTWKPQRHVEISSPGGAGGALDTTARLTDKLLQEMKLLPVTSAVVNRSGGEHAVAYNHVYQRKGDPHQLSFASPVLLANHIAGVLPITYTDVTPVGCLISEYYVFAVRDESAIKSGRDFVEGLKTNPEGYSVAVGTLLTRIAAGLVLQAGNVDLKRTRMVVFSGAAKQTMTVLGGHMDVAVTPLVQVLPHFEAGKMRIIAVTAPQRLPGVLASVPTWADQGYAGAAADTWRCVIAPKDITPAQTAFWENALRQVTEHDEFRKSAERNHWDVSYKSAAETRKFMEAEYADFKRVMTQFGLVSKQ